jgi:RNA methyltransferase, TrmH family
MLNRNDIKFIKSLQNKKYRKIYSACTVEGEKNVLELIQAAWPVERLLVSQEFARKYAEVLSLYTVPAEVVSEDQLSELGYLESNRSALAVVPMRTEALPAIDLQASLIVLCNVQDPGNLGTIIRTADWFGIHQIVCSPLTVEWFNPKVIQATMGAFTRVKIFYQDLAPFLKDLPMPVLAADLKGENLYEYPFQEPSALLMGSESHGIPEDLSAMITDRLTIPAFGASESLNVAIATGIFCYALRTPRP